MTSRHGKMALGEYRVVLRALGHVRMALGQHRVVLRALGRVGVWEEYQDVIR